MAKNNTGQVTLRFKDRTYRLGCGPGEEARLSELTAHVKGKVDGLVREFGQVGEERLFLMAAVLIADELWDARELLELSLDESSNALKQLAGTEKSAPVVAKSQPSKKAGTA